MATVYLIHFEQAYRHARHYLGVAKNLDARIADHRAGVGSRLLRIVSEAGIEWRVVRTWEDGRQLERHWKRLCPCDSRNRLTWRNAASSSASPDAPRPSSHP